MAYYTFDPLGNLPANLIPSESHTITAINGIDHNYIVPRNAPFYAESMVVVRVADGAILKPGIDFEYTHDFVQATTKINRPINGSITFLDPNMNGEFNLTYRTIGGDYVTDTTRAIADGLVAASTVGVVIWDDIVGLPATFPPTPHTHPVTDIESVQQIIDALQAMVAAVSANNRDIHLSDVIDLDIEYIDPLMDRLDAIANAIITTGFNDNLYYEQITPGLNLVDLGAQVDGEWFDTPLQLTPAPGQTGSFELSWDLKIETNVAKTEYEVEHRFVINGSPVPRSNLNGAILGLSDAHSVKLQARIIGASVTECKVSDTNFSSQLTIKRLGN